MSLRTRIERRRPCGRQDSEPPARRLFAARAAFFAMNAQAKPQEGGRPIDLGREDNFGLGRAQIYPSSCEVEVEGRRELLQPRAMQVLVALARAADAVVSRDQLIKLCWEGRVIGEDAINRAIAKVRAAAEWSDPPAFEVETIPRVGFRLKIRESKTGVAADPLSEDAVPAPAPVAARPRNRRGLLVFGTVVAVIVIAALLFAVLRRGAMPDLQMARPAEASIAVLPFLNMSGDPGKEYFSDGLSEELLNDLANAPQLSVAARTSSFAFKGKLANVQEIANKLHVRAVLEGSVRESGNRVRITAQLIDAASGYHLWSQTYDRQLTDILKVQDNIARAIAAALTNKLLAHSPMANGAVDPDAYRKYLLGKAYFDRHTEADNERAAALFKEVTTLQPDFSDGFAMLGYAYLGRIIDPHPDRDMAVAVTRAALDRALALNPRNLTALIAYMDVALFTQDWNAATTFVRRMRRINPNNATVARASGLYYQFLGFPEQSRAAFRLATRLDPLSHVAWGSLASLDASVGRNDEAIAAGHTALALSPGTAGVLAWVCVAHAMRGDFVEARKLIARLAQSEEGRRYQGCALEIARAAGDHTRERQIADDRVNNNQGDPAYLGQNYLEIGDYDKAVPLLQRAYELGDTTLYILPLDPVTPRVFLKSAAWRELTQRPRFRAWQAAHDRVAAELKTQP
jgi:TolB-like protein/DNA-binding winged helix-turn-helix (wHTH) protein/tetratricopeptide (TPR) repeat protein